MRPDLDAVYQACGVVAAIGFCSDGSARVYLAFNARANGTGPETLVVKVSPDRGASWGGAATVIALLGAATAAPSPEIIAYPDGRVWALWLDGVDDANVHLWVARSSDAGQTWTAPVQVDAGLTQPAVSFTVHSDELSGLLVSLQSSEGVSGDRMRFTRSADGLNWASLFEVDGLAVPTSITPARMMSWPDGHLLLVWVDGRAGQRDVWSRVSLDGGRTWPITPLRVDMGDPDGASGSGLPEVVRAGIGKEVVAVWKDRRGGVWRVLANFSADGGASWGRPAGGDAIALSANSTEAVVRGLTMSGHSEGRVTVVWDDPGLDAMLRCGKIACEAAWTTTSCDGGETWEPYSLILDDATIVHWVGLTPFLGAADGLIWSRTGPPQYFYRRLDGPTVAEAKGPATYCVGNDPLVSALAVSAGCPGGLFLQWYVDGAIVPGATTVEYQPSLAAGPHLVEVRGRCLTDPTCAPEAVPAILQVVAPQVPPDVGNALRATRMGTLVALDWTRAASPSGAHSHVRRAATKGQAGTLVSPDPMYSRSFSDAPPLSEALYLFDLRHADVCEFQSAN